MSRTPQLVPTLFDRLLDDEPHQASEAVSKRLCSLGEYKASLIRDLEILVNTRQCLVASQLENYPELAGTILEYGMPDFTSKGVLNPEDRRLIQAQLERAITVGDQRFRAVKVQLLNQQVGYRMLTFRVDAVLHLQDATRQVSFDAVLQVNTQEYKVQNLN
ncbi:type VI secretion system baseplate subunit TssE [Pseudomonas alliivorans]|uniref:type VI secretion system baseplate subunit TssE n=1 Tax=Pseudomonas alliivorans TaxID=2810613 RepID=UPI0016107F37|nr:type VI secretion system baseplate subunit TssE [Pseudomonas alliivorans]MCQ9473308.1 type VI secretion system baseplate subunit TssE [Pseudomonas alliivorans]MEE4341803.1 type VI secretion system baseplate subunit TssE [Pseudomonas alliivorans]MEE4621768.1 type VI secretion system baseplate subunit TssE [Pseudomonas alliivorans]MEE4677902.1 type VI secretion system baseplate subunit TssE [Pseudomonas alliivorans]MEE4679750.1 type VI secretion system baseplate subunit TssE [Pseudomonas alli